MSSPDKVTLDINLRETGGAASAAESPAGSSQDTDDLLSRFFPELSSLQKRANDLLEQLGLDSDEAANQTNSLLSSLISSIAGGSGFVSGAVRGLAGAAASAGLSGGGGGGLAGAAAGIAGSGLLLPVAAVAGALLGLKITVDAVAAANRRASQLINTLADNIGEFSADITRARAEQEIAEIGVRLRRARALGSDLARGIEAETRLQRSIEDLKTSIIKDLLPIIVDFRVLFADSMAGLTNLVRQIRELVPDELVTVGQSLVTAWINQLLQSIGIPVGLLRVLALNARREQENQDDLEELLNQLDRADLFDFENDRRRRNVRNPNG